MESTVYLFSWQLPIIFTKKQIKYHVFNAVTNSELTELVPVFKTRPAFPNFVIKVNTSFKNVWRTWGPALPQLLADLMIFCPLGPIGPTNFKNSVYMILYIFNRPSLTIFRFDITETCLLNNKKVIQFLKCIDFSKNYTSTIICQC